MPHRAYGPKRLRSDAELRVCVIDSKGAQNIGEAQWADGEDDASIFIFD
jgi:hypothetical protein